MNQELKYRDLLSLWTQANKGSLQNLNVLIWQVIYNNNHHWQCVHDVTATVPARLRTESQITSLTAYDGAWTQIPWTPKPLPSLWTVLPVAMPFFKVEKSTSQCNVGKNISWAVKGRVWAECDLICQSYPNKRKRRRRWFVLGILGTKPSLSSHWDFVF